MNKNENFYNDKPCSGAAKPASSKFLSWICSTLTETRLRSVAPAGSFRSLSGLTSFRPSANPLITQSLSHLITSQSAAFTLAEILITLAVIGIVAALTIPNLVQSYKKKIVETRLAKFYSVMNQAIQLSEIDNGPKEYWDELDGVATEGSVNQLIWFEKYFKPYLKYNYVTTDKIFDTTSTIIVYFSDGSLCKMSSGSFQFWPNASDYSLPVYDEENDSYRNPRESSGIKYFTFHFWPYEKYKDDVNWKYHYKKGLEPYLQGWDGTVENLKNDNAIGCKEAVSNERAYCTKLIQMNGWKIPDDYPLKF